MTWCLLVMASGGAYASCLLSNLDGAWRMYLWSGPGAAAIWTKCTVEVGGGTGQVLTNRVCENAAGTTFLTMGGQLSINNVCRVGGSITTEAGTITIRHSFLEANLNQIWTGVATNVDGVDSMFTGVRGLSTGGVGGAAGGDANSEIRQATINGNAITYQIQDNSYGLCVVKIEATNTSSLPVQGHLHFNFYKSGSPRILVGGSNSSLNLPSRTRQTVNALVGAVDSEYSHNFDTNGCNAFDSWELDDAHSAFYTY